MFRKTCILAAILGLMPTAFGEDTAEEGVVGHATTCLEWAFKADNSEVAAEPPKGANASMQARLTNAAGDYTPNPSHLLVVNPNKRRTYEWRFAHGGDSGWVTIAPKEEKIMYLAVPPTAVELEMRYCRGKQY